MTQTQTPTTPNWHDILPEPFVSVILGQRGSGKTALGHLLLERFGNSATDRSAHIIGFPPNKVDLLPEWITPLSPTVGKDDWPDNSVVLVHEAHHLLHARRSMEQENLDIDFLVTVSRHRNSNIIFETQQSQRLDRNMVTAVDAVIFREPALLQAEFERKQLRTLVQNAEEVFNQYTTVVETDDFILRDRSEDAIKTAYVYSSRFDGEYPHEISLANHWSEGISRAYSTEDHLENSENSDRSSSEQQSLSDNERKALAEVAEWEQEHRPVKYDHIGATYTDVTVPHAGSILYQLSTKGLLKVTYSANSSPNQYRLTGDGWDTIKYEEPEQPITTKEERTKE